MSFLFVLLAIFLSICSFLSSFNPVGHIYFSLSFCFFFLSVFFSVYLSVFLCSIFPSTQFSWCLLFSLFVLFSFSFFSVQIFLFCKCFSISLYLSVHPSFSPSLFLRLSIYPSNFSCLSVFICLSIPSLSLSLSLSLSFFLSLSLSHSPSEHTSLSGNI